MHPYLNTAIKAARNAGTIIVRSLDNAAKLEISSKGAANDYVTNVDRACEAEIIKVIHKAYPDHGILGEETGFSLGDNPNEIVWIIDPLDGTLNFIHGFPQFSVSIAIQVRGVVEHGLVYNPLSNELFTASRGRGAQLDGRRIRVSDCKDLEHALLGTGFAYKRSNESLDECMARLKRVLAASADLRRAGSAALDLAYVAAGRLDGFWEVGLAPWDVAAGALLVREAGGFIGDFSGNDQYIKCGQIVAATPKIYGDLLKLLG
jgi:myo-inositol-1(or 4)-monophosphatase